MLNVGRSTAAIVVSRVRLRRANPPGVVAGILLTIATGVHGTPFASSPRIQEIGQAGGVVTAGHRVRCATGNQVEPVKGQQGQETWGAGPCGNRGKTGTLFVLDRLKGQRGGGHRLGHQG